MKLFLSITQQELILFKRDIISFFFNKDNSSFINNVTFLQFLYRKTLQLDFNVARLAFFILYSLIVIFIISSTTFVTND